jgi:hypothetical protein
MTVPSRRLHRWRLMELKTYVQRNRRPRFHCRTREIPTRFCRWTNRFTGLTGSRSLLVVPLIWKAKTLRTLVPTRLTTLAGQALLPSVLESSSHHCRDQAARCCYSLPSVLLGLDCNVYMGAAVSVKSSTCFVCRLWSQG